jgi:hypothetical protein
VRTQAVGNLPQWRLGGPHCWTSGDEPLCSLLEVIVANKEIVENLELITIQSSHIPELCATLMVLQHDIQSQGAS